MCNVFITCVYLMSVRAACLYACKSVSRIACLTVHVRTVPVAAMVSIGSTHPNNTPDRWKNRINNSQFSHNNTPDRAEGWDLE